MPFPQYSTFSTVFKIAQNREVSKLGIQQSCKPDFRYLESRICGKNKLLWVVPCEDIFTFARNSVIIITVINNPAILLANIRTKKGKYSR